MIGRLFSRHGLAAQASVALVAGSMLAAASPASAATTAARELGTSVAADGTTNDKDGHHKPDGFEGCIDSSQQDNDKFLVYVPKRDSLWVWKEDRGDGSVDPWVQFTETPANGGSDPIPKGVVCATIVAKGNDVAITVVTQKDHKQDVWQTECTVSPDNITNPFDPNDRCDPFERLTPLPANGGKDGIGGKDGVGYDPNGPRTGDGATAATEGALGVRTMAGGALLALALIVALLRKRTTT
jgi:hypothetical protein